ncbi:MAG: exodeoxyribonuclease VII small subunit [Chloroflexi bacterium]|nr:MAG: exodeoxyribonuclease VII small subunit [Chloroflexota bacterium]MBL1196805.1 exodeoxyribonuclease VII small subunit [Chloroflexota bacterium]NOH14100.1 exodeoxyribonuclease VII small subunit [Chloroflexota bacterium]
MAEKKAIEKLNYEEAFAELQEIVAALETDEHALEEALALFERGQALARCCAELLEEADLKVQELTDSGDLKEFEE